MPIRRRRLNMIAIAKPTKKPNVSTQQLEKLTLLASLAGSVKTGYKVDVVNSTNELRGKRSNDI